MSFRRSIVSFLLPLSILLAFFTAATFATLPAFASEPEYGEISYSQTATAILADTSFQVHENGDGTATVRVPATEWSRAAMTTERTFIVFSQTGVRLASSSPRLGEAAVEDSETQYVIRRGTARLSPGGEEVLFTGEVLGIADLQELYSAGGPVGGSVGDSEMRAALEAAITGSEDIEAAVVDMPELNEQTASAWTGSLEGDLLMVSFSPNDADDGVVVGEEEGDESAEVSTVALLFDASKYKGFFADVRPLGDAEHESYQDFSDEQFHDGWMVDGDGFLWYVDEDGDHFFFEDSFYAIFEHALNNVTVSNISPGGAKMAEALREQAQPQRDGGIDVSPCIAFTYRGFKVTGYFHLAIRDVSLSLEDMTLTHSVESGLKISYSYDSSIDTGMYFNYCINKGFPVRLHAGPVGLDLFFSWGMEMNAAKLAFSLDSYDLTTSQIDLETGTAVVLSRIHDGDCSFSFGVDATAKFVISVRLGIGPANVLASFDICPVALTASAAVTSSWDWNSQGENGSAGGGPGQPYTCGELSVDLHGYLLIPSVYDRGILGQPSENPFEENFFTALGTLMGDLKYKHELYRVNLFSSHIENGKRVNRCTHGAGVDDGSRVISEKMCSFAKWQDLTVEAGSGRYPSVVVKKLGYGADDTLRRGFDYTVSYNEFPDAGKGVATIRGMGEWSGEVALEYTVCKAPLPGASLTANLNSYTYTGSAIVPETVRRNSKLLREGTDYEVIRCWDNVNAGTGYMRIRGIGNYGGAGTVHFQIVPANIGLADISGLEDKVYTGLAIEQSPALSFGGKVLQLGADYDIAYRNNVNAGKATVLFAGKGNFKGSAYRAFTIEEARIPLPPPGKHLVYSGVAQAGFTTGDKIGQPYGIKGGTLFAKNAGSYSSIAGAHTNYVFENGEKFATIEWSIGAAPMSSVEFTEIASYTYTGSPIEPTPILRLNGNKLDREGTYEVSYSNNVNAGMATVTHTGIGNLEGSRSVAFEIKPRPIRGASVSVAAQTYTGNPLTPEPTVKIGSTVLTKGVDYTLTYSNNTNAGTATVKITGKGNYTDTRSVTFRISPKSIEGASIAAVAHKTYTGSAIKPTPSVTLGSTALKNGTDYSFSYTNNIKVGTATIKVTAKGNYTGSVSSTFKIVQASVASATVSSISDKTYTGSPLTPAPTVKVGSRTLVKGTDYTLSYKNNVNVGTATITITGKGNYKGTKSVTFKIVAKKSANAAAPETLGVLPPLIELEG